MTENFSSIEQRLESLQPGRMKLGLERSMAAVEGLGSPHRAPGIRWVLVGGTNGKGSTVAYLESILRAHGVRVGAYTSPHLVDLTERVRVDGESLSMDAFAQSLAPVLQLVDEGTSLSFFEVVTLAAMDVFARQKVEVAILEVGMGGRLDTTNLVNPAVSIITSIALDHCQWLGDTLEEIAWEKGGIIRPDAPLVTAMDGQLLKAALRERTEPSCLFQWGRDFSMSVEDTGQVYRDEAMTLDGLEPGLVGAHQAINASLAIRASRCLLEKIGTEDLVKGVNTTALAGRFEQREHRGVSWILDGAHNPHAMNALVSCLKQYPPRRPRIVLFAAKDDKAVGEMVSSLGSCVDRWIVTHVEGPGMRDASSLAEQVADFSDRPVECVVSLEDAIQRAEECVGSEGSVLVTGSLYLVGAVLREQRWSGSAADHHAVVDHDGKRLGRRAGPKKI